MIFVNDSASGSMPPAWPLGLWIRCLSSGFTWITLKSLKRIPATSCHLSLHMSKYLTFSLVNVYPWYYICQLTAQTPYTERFIYRLLPVRNDWKRWNTFFFFFFLKNIHKVEPFFNCLNKVTVPSHVMHEENLIWPSYSHFHSSLTKLCLFA